MGEELFMILDWFIIVVLVRGCFMGLCFEFVGSVEYGVGLCGVFKVVMLFLF